MSDVIHLEAYRKAIFRGSRDAPAWDPADIADCERKLRHDAADFRMARDRRKLTQREASKRAAFWNGFDPNGGRAA